MKISNIFALIALSLLPVGRVAAADASPTEVVMFDHAAVDKAFAKGSTLLSASNYTVMALRRVMPGTVEIHNNITDVIYVTEGSATFVTGGTAEGSKTTAPGEIRADKITGGVPRHLTKGDVIVVPAGIPHWFSEVSGTFLYFVVKVAK